MENSLMIIDETTIEIKQLPVIEFKDYETMLEIIEETTSKYENLVLDEENVKDFKDIQAKFNKDIKTLDNFRKAIKKQVSGPIAEFEEKIKRATALMEQKKSHISSQLNDYDIKCKEEKKAEYTKYFLEKQLVMHNIDFVTLDMIEQNNWLNKGTTLKKIYEQIDAFFAKIESDLQIIELNPNGGRIKTIYLDNGFNLAPAIETAMAQIAREAKEQARIDAEMRAKELVVEPEEVAKVVEEVKTAPVVEKVSTIKTATFTIKGDREELLKVREFIYALKDAGKIEVY